MRAAKVLSRLLPWGVVAALAFGVAAMAGVFDSPAHGPRPIVWDREPCAECGMHIGNPSYAAQLWTSEGSVLNFDDPGCLFRYLAEKRPRPEAMYFHHWRESRWLTREGVAFVRVAEAQTPMGGGLGAVDAGAEGAMAFEQASRHVLAHVSRKAP